MTVTHTPPTPEARAAQRARLNRLGVDPDAKPTKRSAPIPKQLTETDIEAAVAKGVRAANQFPTQRSMHEYEYEQAFDAYIRRNRVSPLLEFERRDQGEASTSIGGAVVPISFEQQLLLDMRAATALLGHTDVIDTSEWPSPGGPLDYPTLIDASEQSPSILENTQYGENDAVFGSIQWPNAVNYASAQLARVSYALAQDSAFPLRDLLIGEWSRRTSRGIEADMAAAVVAGVTNVQTLGSAGIFTYADLLAIWSSIDAAYRAQAVWILSTSAMVQLRTLKDTSGRPLLVDAPHVQDTDNQGNVQSAALLLGCKVLESNNGFANNMTSGSIIGFFGAVGKVIPVRFAGAEIIHAPERFADYGQSTWTGFSRWNASTVALASAGALIKAH